MTQLCFDRVSKAYGDKPVLRDFSLSLPAGGRMALMGPSGCGKTTALMLAAGFLTPDRGTVTGRPERFSVVFQEDRLCEDFTVLSNLRLAARRAPREALLAHLRELGLEDSCDTPVRALSGGMKRRVALARAVVYAGELFLLDEPFKGLDAATREAAIGYLLRRTQGKSLLLVTHDPAEAALLGGECFPMPAGAAE